jgi:hypothetical protein
MGLRRIPGWMTGKPEIGRIGKGKPTTLPELMPMSGRDSWIAGRQRQPRRQQTASALVSQLFKPRDVRGWPEERPRLPSGATPESRSVVMTTERFGICNSNRMFQVAAIACRKA